MNMDIFDYKSPQLNTINLNIVNFIPTKDNNVTSPNKIITLFQDDTINIVKYFNELQPRIIDPYLLSIMNHINCNDIIKLLLQVNTFITNEDLENIQDLLLSNRIDDLKIYLLQLVNEYRKLDELPFKDSEFKFEKMFHELKINQDNIQEKYQYLLIEFLTNQNMKHIVNRLNPKLIIDITEIGFNSNELWKSIEKIDL